MITSRHNPKVQQIRALSSSARERRSAGLLVVSGARAVEAALGFGVRPEVVYRAMPPRGAPPTEVGSLEVVDVDRTVLAWAASVESEVDFVALFPFVARTAREGASDSGRALILEDVSDPGNVGSAVRSAAGAGADCVVMAGSCADWTNPKSVRASAGAVFALPVIEADSVADAVRWLGLPTYGADPRAGDSVFSVIPPERYAVAVGHETRGLTEEARAACDSLVRIPLARGVESLNVAAAAAVCLFVLLSSGATPPEG